MPGHTDPDRRAPDLLAYCDLYCGDCAGHAGTIADGAERLREAVEAFDFERTARCLFADRLPEFDRVVKAIAFLTKLRCAAPCRLREKESTACRVRACCIEKRLVACHACDAFETCDTLRENVARCGYASIQNIRAIREIGLDDWIRSGDRRWFAPPEGSVDD